MGRARVLCPPPAPFPPPRPHIQILGLADGDGPIPSPFSSCPPCALGLTAEGGQELLACSSHPAQTPSLGSEVSPPHTQSPPLASRNMQTPAGHLHAPRLAPLPAAGSVSSGRAPRPGSPELRELRSALPYVCSGLAPSVSARVCLWVWGGAGWAVVSRVPSPNGQRGSGDSVQGSLGSADAERAGGRLHPGQWSQGTGGQRSGGWSQVVFGS